MGVRDQNGIHAINPVLKGLLAQIGGCINQDTFTLSL
jgi:hypothetical protein